MLPRSHRLFSFSNAVDSGRPQLTFARLIVSLENILSVFARPLMLAGFFAALAWLGVFAALYPWAHLVALVVFVIFLFDALGRARRHWRPTPPSLACRRVEEASGLQHRPLDVLEDRPITLGADQMALWQMHAARAREQIKNLRWPSWKLAFDERDPYALRYAMLILLVVGLLSGWGALGGRLIAAINPTLGKLHMTAPALDAWITPPEYTHLPPIMIATPAGMRLDKTVIDVPEGSILSAHLAEKDGAAPTLDVNDDSVSFTAEDQKDYEATQAITGGDRISIARGWQLLGSWRIHVVPDQAPRVAFTEPPSASERKSVKISYEAADDYGVATIMLRVTPRESLPGASDDPIEIPIAAPEAKDVKRASFEDLTAHPWAGLPVQLQLIVTDAVGHKAQSENADFTLPERVFFHPVARALIDARKKLLQGPFDENVRNDTANLMAGIAHQPSNYRGDPLILMALRSGAVRLILDHGREATLSVNDILWQSAVRIEDGTIGAAEQNLRQAQKELADALDRNASEQDVQKLIDRLHQALAQYLSELSTRMAKRPGPVEDLSQLSGLQTNMLTPKDLDRMLDEMRSLSAAGSREAAREELSRMQQLLENLRTDTPQLSDEQRAALEHLKTIRALAHDQQQLLDKTFQKAEAGKNESRKLATEQNALLGRLHGLLGAMKGQDTGDLSHGADAMQRAGSALLEGMAQGALPHQNEALKALQQAEQAMLDDLRQSLFMLPMPGVGMARSDPFGREYGNMLRDDQGVKVPDQMEVRRVREILNELQRRAGDTARPKTERDYIDRLLQNF
jgi:uncharacterized protein (TIGR02302 family)